MRYVLGFYFDRHGRVALIEKKKPDWQSGRLNGIGGKVEEGESPLAAMTREFQEETGARVAKWKHFCDLEGPNWIVYCFRAEGDAEIKTTAPEEGDVEWRLADGPTVDICGVSNLRWLIALARDKGDAAGAPAISVVKYLGGVNCG